MIQYTKIKTKTTSTYAKKICFGEQHYPHVLVLVVCLPLHESQTSQVNSRRSKSLLFLSYCVNRRSVDLFQNFIFNTDYFWSWKVIDLSLLFFLSFFLWLLLIVKIKCAAYKLLLIYQYNNIIIIINKKKYNKIIIIEEEERKRRTKERRREK